MPDAVPRRGWIYWADLNPRRGTEPGKVRPVLVVQTDLLNVVHPSTIVLPLTTVVAPKASVLRVYLKRGEGGLEADSDVMVDQLRAVDNRRLVRALGPLPSEKLRQVERGVSAVLDLGP